MFTSIALLLSFLTWGADLKLDADFELPLPAAQRVYREELLTAILRNPNANIATRAKWRKDVEKLAADLFLKGQKIYNLPRKNLKVYWNSLSPSEVGYARFNEGQFEIHLNEILFFSYHNDYVGNVIPHEVAHLIHYLQWGYQKDSHGSTFHWVVSELAPSYVHFEFDLTPACRLSQRLLKANGNTGYDSECEKYQFR
ncbi:MAG: SprT-like domain-containing protein [Candidatus Doudnabacteria bacterium]|nr:SprT-like domain-containing protein [Candidatus Doudnabacteria bacterium]